MEKESCYFLFDKTNHLSKAKDNKSSFEAHKDNIEVMREVAHSNRSSFSQDVVSDNNENESTIKKIKQLDINFESMSEKNFFHIL